VTRAGGRAFVVAGALLALGLSAAAPLLARVHDPMRIREADLSGLVLPTTTLTPGRLNPDVRQTTIDRTICVSGWTKKVRPPPAYTDKLKVEQMPLYHEVGPPSNYEEDHLIPLELGGAPKNPKNLWPEPHTQSKLSDPLETALKNKVCNRMSTLAAARMQIVKYKRVHG
jgi:hypothetical protein